MGEYHKAVVLKRDRVTVDKFITSWDYDNGAKIDEHSYITNSYVSAFECIIYKNPQRVIWAGDYAPPCKMRRTTVYDRCIESKKARQSITVKEINRRFIINHTKRIFVDKTKTTENSMGLRFHPLPFLTMEASNTDSYKEINPHIGRWARDRISIDSEVPKGYKELEFNLTTLSK